MLKMVGFHCMMKFIMASYRFYTTVPPKHPQPRLPTAPPPNHNLVKTNTETGERAAWLRDS